MDEIPQSELDRQDYMNEVTLPFLQLIRSGGPKEILRRYNDKQVRNPQEYFGYNPLEGFPSEFEGLANSINQALRKGEGEPKVWFELIALGYKFGGRNLPDDIKTFLG